MHILKNMAWEKPVFMIDGNNIAKQKTPRKKATKTVEILYDKLGLNGLGNPGKGMHIILNNIDSDYEKDIK